MNPFVQEIGLLDRTGKSKQSRCMKRTFFLMCLGAELLLGTQVDAADAVKENIARKIWQNECAGSVKGLVSWNAGEEFPSLGIGHFIWYPRGVKGRFEESFPEFVRFAKSRGISVPRWLEGAAPWNTRKQFQAADVKGGLADSMRSWLASHVEIQADFIIARSLASLKRMQGASSSPGKIAKRYYAVASTPQGMYALIDYVNFKGEGTNPEERYQGRGWGLLQVLEEMGDVSPGAGAARAFSSAAGNVLTRRVNNSPSSRGEKRWLAGWLNRCRTYARP